MLWLAFEQFCADHAGGRKFIDDDLPTQAHVLGLVVIGQQFFPWRGQVFVGRQCRDQRTHGDVAFDRQIPADRIEQKWCQLCYEVVEKLKFISFDNEQKVSPKLEINEKNVTINRYKDKISDVKNEKIKQSLLELTKLFKKK